MHDLLFCLWSVLNDALYPLYYNNVDDFINEFGFDGDLKAIRKGEKIYNECKNTYIQLGLGEENINDLLENLAELGIE